ncbi:hypothetical protein Tco_0705710 [Tanacetum coccineum]|uniref:Uncharacterized protein n=1 Tax=Tanacetum coccineum TaxID=301880 RepID=A0ABQ4Y5E2_9ASTR
MIAFTSPFGLATVLPGREPDTEVEAVLLFTNLVSSFQNQPLTHHVPEGLELGKLVVDEPGVEKLVLG